MRGKLWLTGGWESLFPIRQGGGIYLKLFSYLGLICLFLLFSPLGFSHVPLSAGCFSVISFSLVYCVCDPFLGRKAVVPLNYGIYLS